jgi:hypothetical protein
VATIYLTHCVVPLFAPFNGHGVLKNSYFEHLAAVNEGPGALASCREERLVVLEINL